MTSTDFTLLDLKNLLEWFELIPQNSKSDEKFQRTQEKIRGLFVWEFSPFTYTVKQGKGQDRSEPLLENLISSTMMDLELYTPGDLKSAKSSLLNRKTWLEENSTRNEKEILVKTTVIKSEIDTLQNQLESFIVKEKETRTTTAREISKIISALSKIDEKLKGVTDD
jgi:hypothetical protein